MSAIQLNLFDMKESASPKLSELASKFPAVCPLVKFAQENAESALQYIVRHMEERVDFFIAVPVSDKEGYFFVVQSIKGKMKTNKRPMMEDKIQKFIHPIFRKNNNFPGPKIGRYHLKSNPWESNPCLEVAK